MISTHIAETSLTMEVATLTYRAVAKVIIVNNMSWYSSICAGHCLCC